MERVSGNIESTKDCQTKIDSLLGYTKVRVEEIHKLSDNRIVSLNFHSTINLLNGISGYIQLLELEDDNISFNDTLELINNLSNNLLKGDITLSNILFEVVNIYSKLNLEIDKNNISLYSDDIKENLKEVLELMEVLFLQVKDIAELDKNEVRKFSIFDLKNRLIKIYCHVAKNSKGRYGIVFDKESQSENDYFIDLEFSSVLGDEIYIPIVLEDIIRDLSLNSRKYSNPGTDIKVQLSQTEECIIISIDDQGIGIPNDEIEKIFLPEQRGSNVSSGGYGLGLTKAYYLVKEIFKGEIYIKSKEGKGTSIKLFIPLKISKK